MNRQNKTKHIHRYREETNGCQRRGVLGGGWTKQVKLTERYDLPVINKTRYVMYGIGNIVTNIVKTLYGDRWELGLSW